MKYYLKHPQKDAWAYLSPSPIYQEEINALKNYVEHQNKPKLSLALDKLLLILSKSQKEISETPYKHYTNYTKESFTYLLYTLSYFTKKTSAGSYTVETLQSAGEQLDLLKPHFKAFKNIKLSETDKNWYPKLEHLLSTIRSCCNKPSWYINNQWEGTLEEDSLEARFVKGETYVLLSETGYLNADGYSNAHLSGARLFPSFDTAKRSQATRRNAPAIVKIKMEFQEVMLGANATTDKMAAFVEKQRIEEFLNSTNLEELKAQIVEYEKRLNIHQETKEEPKKKIKI